MPASQSLHQSESKVPHPEVKVVVVVRDASVALDVGADAVVAVVVVLDVEDVQ